jgi:serine protease Do
MALHSALGSLLLRRILILLFILTGTAQGQQTAQNLFSQHQSALYQIRIIELESGNKSSIGSGFQVDALGNMLTNYHVVSDYVFYPEKYRIEFITSEGQTGPLNLIYFDVVNDLALVRKVAVHESEHAFTVATELPEQGSTIYSLGNPHDLGMIVVPGTFNGLKKNSFYQRIHFTGSINPGMSGGPVVNPEGEVMGVNVATAGNQIGFLIPLKKVTAILQKRQNEVLPKEAFKPTIQEQLLDNQRDMISILQNTEWVSNPLGDASVPTKIGDFLSCWGDSNTSDQEALFLSVENRCRLDEQIYLHSGLMSGGVELEFEWLSGKDLGDHRFYSLYSKSLAGAGPSNNAGKTDVSNFQCQQHKVVNIHGVSSKTVFCLRAYKEFNELYDVVFVGATLDHDQQGLISHFTLAGVSQSSAQSFTQQFMDAITWR